MESELQRNRGIKPLDMIKQIAQIWNQSHCSPPLNDIEFEKQWKDALNFVEKSINNDNNSPSDIDEGNNDDEVDAEDDNDLEFSNDNNTADERKSNDTRNNNDDGDTKSIPQILVKLALENSTLFKNEFGIPHARVKINNCFDVLSIEGKKFESYLSKIYYDHDNKKKIASAEAIKNAKRILVAKAIFEGQTIQLHLRVAWSNHNTENKDSIHYDMTDDKRRCIKITKGNGWKVVENQIEVLFKRYGHQAPQIEPLYDYDDYKVLDNFIDSLNIKNEKHKLLIKVWIISLLIPDISRVILLPYGPPGSAKSTLLKKIQLLIDPTQLDLLSINDSKTEYIQQISHHYLCFFDNISYVPRWLPDEACRTATGAASSKRELYTDDEDIPYKYKRPQGFAGINVIFTQEDLLDRSIKIELDRIEQENNIPDTKIEEGLKQQIPKLLGYILDVVSKALEIKDSVNLKRLPRMADFAEWGEAIARALGYKHFEFLDAYFENIDQQHLEIVESDPFAETISKFIDYDTRSWISSPKVFINYLREYADANNIDNSKFPKALQTISFRLNKIKPTLLESLGIEIIIERITKRKGTSKNKLNTSLIKIRKRSPTPPTPPAYENDEGNEGKNAGDLLKDAGGEISNSNNTSPALNNQNHAQISNDISSAGDAGDVGDVFGKSFMSSSSSLPSLFTCHYCSYQGKSEDEVLIHSVNTHPGKPAQPDEAITNLKNDEKIL
jgi:hypothetical protein